MMMSGTKASELGSIAGIVRTIIDLPRDTALDLVTTSGYGAL